MLSPQLVEFFLQDGTNQWTQPFNQLALTQVFAAPIRVARIGDHIEVEVQVVDGDGHRGSQMAGMRKLAPTVRKRG